MKIAKIPYWHFYGIVSNTCSYAGLLEYYCVLWLYGMPWPCFRRVLVGVSSIDESAS
jgi:hypothetical protein